MNIYRELFLASIGIVELSAREAKRLAAAVSRNIPKEKAKKAFTALVAEGEKSTRASAHTVDLLLKKVMRELDSPQREKTKARQ